MNIETTDNNEMLRDRDDAVSDIKVCEFALACGVTHHRDGFPVQDRIDTNRRIVDRINAELSRRAALAVPVPMVMQL